MTRGRRPGSVSVLAVDGIEPVREVDMHAAVPSRALALARALSALPPAIVLVSCEPAEMDELKMKLTGAVQAGVDHALTEIRWLTSPARLAAAQDEILQVLFWLRGERLAQDASAAELVRFVTLPLAEVEQVLLRLAAVGLVAASTRTSGDGAAEPRYRLSDEGAREGGRRFADEFADLTRPGHGECGDPDCECRRTGNTDDCRNRTVN